MKHLAALTWPNIFWLIFWAIVITQFPISYWIVRRVVRRHRERKLIAARVAAIAVGDFPVVADRDASRG